MGVLMTWMREGSQVQMRDPVPQARDELGELLAEWFEYERNFRPHLGFKSWSLASREYFADDGTRSDDEVDAALLAGRARIVAECIETLAVPLRVALRTEMHNLSTGATVFRNPRSQVTHGADYQAALLLMRRMLVDRGLIEKPLAARKSRL